MNISKKQKIELVLLIILIIILIIVTMWVKNIIETKPKLATNNNDTYEITKTYSFYDTSSNLNKYNPPYEEYINYQISEYYINIETIDGFIKKYDEKIIIRYNYFDENIINNITNYCNSFNEIEHNYEFRCNYETDKITLNNSFNLANLNKTIKTNKKEVTLLYNYNDQIKDYLNDNIKYDIKTK